jgi:hypothetical protein
MEASLALQLRRMGRAYQIHIFVLVSRLALSLVRCRAGRGNSSAEMNLQLVNKEEGSSVDVGLRSRCDPFSHTPDVVIGAQAVGVVVPAGSDPTIPSLRN